MRTLLPFSNACLRASRAGIATGLALLTCAAAQAHTGHGLPGTSHWHADNVLLVLALAAAGAVGLWLTRRK